MGELAGWEVLLWLWIAWQFADALGKLHTLWVWSRPAKKVGGL